MKISNREVEKGKKKRFEFNEDIYVFFNSYFVLFQPF